MGSKANKRALREKRESRMYYANIVTAVVTTLSLVAALVALTIQHKSFLNDMRNDREDSYIDPLNYHVHAEESSEGEAVNLSYNPYGIEVIRPSRIIVSAEQGGIRRVRCVLRYDNHYIAMSQQLDLTEDVERDDIYAEDLEYWITDMPIYRYFTATTSNWIPNENTNSFYSYVFLIIEGYDNSIQTNLLVYEYQVDEENKLTGTNNIRVYDKIDILRTYDADPSWPEPDLIALREYDSLLKDLAKIP